MADNIYDYDGRYEGEEIDDLLDKLKSLQNYDDTAINEAVNKLRSDFNTLVKSDTSGAIDKFNEIIAFLDGIEDSQSLDSIIASIERQIAGKQSAITDLDTIRDGAAKGQTSAQSVYINGQLKTPDGKGIINLGNIDPAVDTYVADFNLYDVLAGTAVTIKEDFVEALRNNKVIFIPYRTFVVIATAQLQADEDSMIYISIQARINEQLIEVQFSCDTVPSTVVGRIFTTTLATKEELDKKVGKGEAIDFATDLTGVVEATPEMFTYRPSAGDKSVRDESAVIRRIKGNTSVWGQLISGLNNDLVKIEKEGDAWIITPIGNATRPGSIAWGSGWASFKVSHPLNTDHIYLYCVTFTKISKRTDLGDFVPQRTVFSLFGEYIYLDIDLGQRTTAVLISKPGVSANNAFLSLNDCVTKIENPMLIDLTDLFGAGNEPTTYEEFKALYPKKYYPYSAPEVRSMRATGIETIGFNAFNGEYAEVIGGQTYYLGDTINTAHFATEIGGDSVEITIPENRLYTPPTNGYIYATGSDICINLSHSGVRNGEYKPYEKNTLLLPEIAKYFPNGMHGIGDVYDEINEELAIQRCDVRAYEEGDESNAEVMTDNVTTVYKLAEPIYTPIDEPMQLDYKVDDFGTERMLSDAPSSPFKADIVYQFNAEGRIRDNSRNIERLEEQLQNAGVQSDWLDNNPDSKAFIKNKPTLPTQVATATEVIAVYGIPTQMLPNVVYEVRVSIDTNFTFPQLVAGEENVSNVWKLIAYMLQGTAISYPSTIKWRNGISPTIDAPAFVEFTFTSITGRNDILGEWKLYK